jgi:hypothetical protein
VAGEIVATTLDGLRVRQRPGLNSIVVAGLLPIATDLEVVMGPILAEANGWFLVRDADADEPEFNEGWIASGFLPEPYLSPTGRIAVDSPYVASFAQTGEAEYGPIEIGDGDHMIRWVAVDPERVRCQLAVSLGPAGSTEPIPAIRATVGNGIDPGTLQPASFAALGVRGPTFVFVESDCSWTLAILRVPPAETPAPSPAP